MMDGKAIENIERIVKDGIVFTGNDGHEYSPADMKRVYSDPRPAPLKVRTLSGLVDFLKTDQAAEWKEKSPIIMVESHARVSVLSKPFGESAKRSEVIAAELDRPAFPFGSWMDPEKLVISCQACFEQSEGMTDVLAYAGKLTVKNEITTEDDGVTQHAMVKKGLSGGLVEGKALPSRVTLVPFRTFDEVDQPASEFVFRVKSVGEAVLCAIFEADAGAWKSDAAVTVKRWLADHVGGIPVIA